MVQEVVGQIPKLGLGAEPILHGPQDTSRHILPFLVDRPSFWWTQAHLMRRLWHNEVSRFPDIAISDSKG